MDRIVLACSGDLLTSAAIAWLLDEHRGEVVTVTLDLGEGLELEDVRTRAIALGASRAHVLDARMEFARDFVAPALRAGALGTGGNVLSRPLGHAAIARQLVNIAKIEGATRVAHGGSTGITRGIAALAPDLRVIEVARAWASSSSERDLAGRIESRGATVPARASGDWRVSANLWGRVTAGAALADLWRDLPDDLPVWTKAPADGPDAPALVDLSFDDGLPVSITGVEMNLLELIQSLETIAGAHGVGRFQIVRPGGGAYAREVHEAPSAVALHVAHAALQTLVTQPDLDQLARDLSSRYAAIVEAGDWFSPTRDALDAFVARVQRRVAGSVRLALFKGSCQVVGRRAAPDVAGAPASTSDAARRSGVPLNTPY